MSKRKPDTILPQNEAAVMVMLTGPWDLVALKLQESAGHGKMMFWCLGCRCLHLESTPMSPNEINAIQPRPQVGELPNGGKAITQSIQLNFNASKDWKKSWWKLKWIQMIYCITILWDSWRMSESYTYGSHVLIVFCTSQVKEKRVKCTFIMFARSRRMGVMAMGHDTSAFEMRHDGSLQICSPPPSCN